MVTTVAIATATRDAILAACSDRTVESCGLLFGAVGLVDRAQPCRNVAERPRNSFEIDPIALIAAHRAQRAGGDRIVGCFHSHPNGRAAPSSLDVAMSEPGSYWAIVAAGQLTMWWRDVTCLRPCALTLL